MSQPNFQSQIQDLCSHVSRPEPNVRPPSSQLSESYQALLDKAATLRGRPLFYPYLSSGRGSGPFVELLDGSVKLDLIGGIGVHIMGHSHPELMQAAIQGSLADTVHQGHLQMGLEYISVLEELIAYAEESQGAWCHAWLTTSGTMANENAVKMCRQKKNGARYIIAMEKAFAGRSTLMAEVTDNPNYRQGLPSYPEVLRVPFPESYCSHDSTVDFTQCAARVKELITRYAQEHPDDICAFTFEPILGEGGFKVAHKDFFVPITQHCQELGIPVWADEVQTFLRTESPFACDYFGFSQWVDVVTVAKGLQCAATLFTKDFNPKPGLISGTFAGTGSALASSHFILKELREGSYYGPQGRIAQIHSTFVDKLSELAKNKWPSILSNISGVGLMLSFDIADGKPDMIIKFLKACFHNGLIVFGCGRGKMRVRMLLPAVLQEQHMDVACQIIDKGLTQMKAEGTLG